MRALILASLVVAAGLSVAVSVSAFAAGGTISTVAHVARGAEPVRLYQPICGMRLERASRGNDDGLPVLCR